MGRLEEESKKKAHRANLQKIILGTVAAAGMLSIAAVAPNALGAMVKLGLVPAKRQKEFISTSRNRLLKQGLLTYEGKFLRLTPRGERRLRQLQIDEYIPEKPATWDGKWRVLIFDIPERKKGMRDRIRHTLLQIGFKRLQDSVWIFPYDCEDILLLLKADLRIGKDLLYMIVDSLEYDAPLRSHFNIRQ